MYVQTLITSESLVSHKGDWSHLERPRAQTPRAALASPWSPIIQETKMNNPEGSTVRCFFSVKSLGDPQTKWRSAWETHGFLNDGCAIATWEQGI